MITQQKVNSFLLLAEELNFSRAAQKLYISQQALSAQISALENDLGFPLFVRTTKSVRLTEAGEQTADFFRRSAAELQSLTAAYRKSVGTLLRIDKVGIWCYIPNIPTKQVDKCKGEFRHDPSIRRPAEK